jgi:hypothetical protein
MLRDQEEEEKAALKEDNSLMPAGEHFATVHGPRGALSWQLWSRGVASYGVNRPCFARPGPSSSFEIAVEVGGLYDAVCGCGGRPGLCAGAGAAARACLLVLARARLRRAAPVRAHACWRNQMPPCAHRQDARTAIAAREEELAAKAFELEAKEGRLCAASANGQGERASLACLAAPHVARAALPHTPGGCCCGI